MITKIAGTAQSWETSAINLDVKVKQALVQQITKLPGVVTVLNYSNNFNKGSKPRLDSDLDLVICVDDTKDLSIFIADLEYCLSRYPMFFRNLPWVIPKNLWRSFIDSQPYDVQVLTDLLKKNPDNLQKFFSRYELVLEGLFAIVARMQNKQYDRLLHKYVVRTWLNFEESSEIFYDSPANKKISIDKIPDNCSPADYLRTFKKLKQQTEQLSTDLSTALKLASPQEQVLYIPGSKSGIFFIPTELYPVLSRHIEQVDFLSLKVMSASVISYAHAMVQKPPTQSTHKATTLKAAFIQRKILHHKILKFTENNNLTDKVALPYFARIQKMKTMKFR